MLQRADPALVRAAHEARKKYHDLLLVELPYANPEKGMGLFLFRGMGYSEFDSFSKDAQLGDITDLLIEEFLLWPTAQEWEKNPIHEVDAGAYEEVAVLLVQASGFDEKRSLLDAQAHGRAMAGTPFSAAQMFICKAFPGMTPSTVASLPVQETFRLIAMAEHVLGQNGEPLQFPLREFLGDGRKRQRTSIPRDFTQLPVLSPEQIMELQGNVEREVIQDTIRRRRQLNANPEARAARSMEIRRQKMDAIASQRMRRTMDAQQAADQESAELSREFGRE